MISSITGQFDEPHSEFYRNGIWGVTLKGENIENYGKTGVDIISVGSITNSVKGIDVSLEI